MALAAAPCIGSALRSRPSAKYEQTQNKLFPLAGGAADDPQSIFWKSEDPLSELVDHLINRRVDYDVSFESPKV